MENDKKIETLAEAIRLARKVGVMKASKESGISYSTLKRWKEKTEKYGKGYSIKKILKKFIKPPKTKPVRKKRTINSIEEYQNILLISRFITIEEHRYCLTMATDAKSGFICLCLSNKRDILSRNRFIEHIEYFLKKREIYPKFIGDNPNSSLEKIRNVKIKGNNWDYHRNFSVKLFKQFLIFKDKFSLLISDKINLTLLYLFQLSSFGGKSISPLIINGTDKKHSIILSEKEVEEIKNRSLLVLDQKFRSYNSENKLKILDLRESLGIDFTNTMVMKGDYLRSNKSYLETEEFYSEVVHNDKTPIEIKIKFYIDNSNIKFYLGEYKEAEKLLSKVHEISKNRNYNEGIVNSLITGCYIFLDMEDFPNLEKYTKLIKSFIIMGIENTTFNKYKMLLGDIYSKRKDYKKAEVIFEKTRKTLEKQNNDPIRLTAIYHRIATNSLKLNKYKKALSYAIKFEKHIYKNENLINSNYKFQKILLFTQIYLKKGVLDKAMDNLKLAEKETKKFPQKHAQRITLYNIWTLFYSEYLNDNKKALSYAKKALKIAKKNENKPYILICERNYLKIREKSLKQEKK